MGLNPQESDNVIEVPVPKMTKEVRENLVKNIKKSAEGYRERIRGVRRDAISKVKKQKGESGVSEDDIHKKEKEVQFYIFSNPNSYKLLLTTLSKKWTPLSHKKKMRLIPCNKTSYRTTVKAFQLTLTVTSIVTIAQPIYWILACTYRVFGIMNYTKLWLDKDKDGDRVYHKW